VANALSHSTQEEERSGKMADMLHGSILFTTSQPQCNMIIVDEKIQFDYVKDTEFRKIYEMFKKQNALIQDNVRVGGLIYIPKQDRKTVLKVCHEEEEHTRGNKLAKQVEKPFYWDNLRKDCKRYVETCQQCQANKSDKTKPAEMLHLLSVLD
jgi:Integrase zinc binding domain